MAPAWDNVFHVLNPNAERRPAVSAFFESRRWQRIWIDRTSHPTHLETAVNWAVNEGRREIAVWGGDGTLSRAVNALAELDALSTTRVLLVPAGTCNDFARQLNLPPWERMAEGVELVEKTVDLGSLQHEGGTRLFVNNAGFGRRPEARREKRPSPIADIYRLSPVPLELEWHAGDRVQRAELPALLGIVFNAPYFGGGLHFSKDVRPDDGRLDGFFLEDQARWRVLLSFIRGRGGKPFSNGAMTSVSGETIRAWTSGELFPQADGELASAGAVREIVFRALPRALTLLVPK